MAKATVKAYASSPISSCRMWSVSGKLVLPVDVVVASRLEPDGSQPQIAAYL